MTDNGKLPVSVYPIYRGSSILNIMSRIAKILSIRLSKFRYNECALNETEEQWFHLPENIQGSRFNKEARLLLTIPILFHVLC